MADSEEEVVQAVDLSGSSSEAEESGAGADVSGDAEAGATEDQAAEREATALGQIAQLASSGAANARPGSDLANLLDSIALIAADTMKKNATQRLYLDGDAMPMFMVLSKAEARAIIDGFPDGGVFPERFIITTPQVATDLLAYLGDADVT